MTRTKHNKKIYDDTNFIGKIIKNARDKANMTQAQLAEIVELSDKNIGSIENGKQYPHLTNFLRLLEVLPITIEDFGVKKSASDNEIREKILKLVYSSTDTRARKYYDALKLIDKIESYK